MKIPDEFTQQVSKLKDQRDEAWEGIERLKAEIERLRDERWELIQDFMEGTHEAFCIGDCGRLTANGYCRDCMTHGGVNAYDRLALAEGFLAEANLEAGRLREALRDILNVVETYKFSKSENLPHTRLGRSLERAREALEDKLEK